jgi:hypothetical protein
MKPCVEVLSRIMIRELRFADSYDSSEFSSRSSRTWRFKQMQIGANLGLIWHCRSRVNLAVMPALELKRGLIHAMDT